MLGQVQNYNASILVNLRKSSFQIWNDGYKFVWCSRWKQTSPSKHVPMKLFLEFPKCGRSAIVNTVPSSQPWIKSGTLNYSAGYKHSWYVGFGMACTINARWIILTVHHVNWSCLFYSSCITPEPRGCWRLGSNKFWGTKCLSNCRIVLCLYSRSTAAHISKINVFSSLMGSLALAINACIPDVILTIMYKHTMLINHTRA